MAVQLYQYTLQIYEGNYGYISRVFCHMPWTQDKDLNLSLTVCLSCGI